MHSDDVFRAQLQNTIASLRYWIPSIADAVRVEEIEDEGFWKISVIPKTQGACPFELIFRADRHFDMVIAGETFEDLELSSFDLFLPLVEAIADGRVIQRRRVSQATGALREIETIVLLKNGQDWRRLRTLGEATALVTSEDTERRDRHFLSYRR